MEFIKGTAVWYTLVMKIFYVKYENFGMIPRFVYTLKSIYCNLLRKIISRVRLREQFWIVAWFGILNNTTWKASPFTLNDHFETLCAKQNNHPFIFLRRWKSLVDIVHILAEKEHFFLRNEKNIIYSVEIHVINVTCQFKFNIVAIQYYQMKNNFSKSMKQLLIHK